MECTSAGIRADADANTRVVVMTMLEKFEETKQRFWFFFFAFTRDDSL